MKRSVRICHITVGHHPLDDRIFYKELRSLAKEYEQVYLVAPDRLPIEAKDGVQFRLFRQGGFFANLWRAYRLAKNLHADIYHIHEFEFLPLALLLKYRFGRKVIYDAHETIYYYFTEFSRHSKFVTFLPAMIAQGLEWFCSRFVDHVITVTPWVAAGFRPFRKEISLIYNFPRLAFFPAAEPKTGPPIILYPGQLVPARNIDVMIEAMVEVKKEFPSARLVIVGGISDLYKARLDAIVTRLQLQDVVEFRPPVPYEKIPELLQTATIGLSSMAPNESFKRSIQIKPFEFMAMGIPVLGCRVPSIEIFVEKTGAGLIVDPPTAQNLGKTILRLLRNPGLMREMGQRGQAAVTQKYNWSPMEKRLLNIYRKLAP